MLVLGLKEMKNMMVKKDDEGIKKLRLIINDEVEGIIAEMKRNEDELNGMNVIEL